MQRLPDVDAQAIEAVLRRAFGDATSPSFSRTLEGVSAQVYRVQRGDEVFYLRIAEEAGQDLRVDAELWAELRRRGVSVPEAVFVDALDAGLGRSVLLMTEIPGAPLASHLRADHAAEVARAAGRDLARLNQVPVEGFGWVERDRPHVAGAPLRARRPDYADFVVAYLPAPWPGWLDRRFAADEIAAIEASLAVERATARPLGRLAHGDFDAEQIFCRDGRYTGMIDLGEIRGAEPLFDLGHFFLWHGDDPDGAGRLLAPLCAGYHEVAPLPADHEVALRRSALLLGLRQLCLWIDGRRQLPLDHPAVVRRLRRLREIVRETA